MSRPIPVRKVSIKLAVAVAKGHRSLPYDRVGDAVIRVRASQAWIGTRLAFEFLVLCAAPRG